MSGPSRVLFSLNGDPVLIEDREDEDRFLRQLVKDLHEEHMVVEPRREDSVELEDEEEEDPEEDPMEDAEVGPEGEQGVVAPAADPVTEPAADDDVWIEDPLEESDDESYIDWDDVLHIDDPPLAGLLDGEDAPLVEHPGLDVEGEGFVEMEAEEQGM